MSTLLDGLDIWEKSRIKFRLGYAGACLQVKSNHLLVVQRLLDYFDGFQDSEGSQDHCDRVLYAFHHQEALATLRERVGAAETRALPGSAWRVGDLGGERFALHQQRPLAIALGEEMALLGDVANHFADLAQLVNGSLAEHWRGEGAAILRAAGVESNGKALMLVGKPGEGVDAVLLHLLEHGYRFLGDRTLALRPSENGIEAIGTPLFPEVLAGNLIAHPRFRMLMSAEEQARLQTLPKEELYAPDQAREVFLDKFYAGGKASSRGKLSGVVVIRFPWQGAPYEVRALSDREFYEISSTLAWQSDLSPEPATAPSEELLAAIFAQVPVSLAQGDLDTRAIRRAFRELSLIDD